MILNSELDARLRRRICCAAHVVRLYSASTRWCGHDCGERPNPANRGSSV